MGLLAKLFRKRLIQVSSAQYDDGWERIPISFHLYENGWGRRSYRVQAPPGVLGARQHRFFESGVLAWVEGGKLPPVTLEDERSARARKDADHAVEREAAARLDRADRERILKLLNMLGSEHDGEILNAAKAAMALLNARNTSWRSVVQVDPEPPAA